MKDERDSRRREIAAALIDAGVEVVIYDAGKRYPTQRQAREECLRAVVTDAAAEAGEIRLVLEQDDSLVQWDAQRLIELARAAGCRDWLRYATCGLLAEQLLAVPDAVAWCWAHGGEWRRRVDPVVRLIRQV